MEWKMQIGKKDRTGVNRSRSLRASLFQLGKSIPQLRMSQGGSGAKVTYPHGAAVWRQLAIQSSDRRRAPCTQPIGRSMTAHFSSDHSER